MVHQYMIEESQEISHYCFRKYFHDGYPVMPLMLCVKALYENDLPANLLDMMKSYLALHCAYWVMDLSSSCWKWPTVTKHPVFGAEIAWKLTKRCSQDYVGARFHPWYIVKFANHNSHAFVREDGDVRRSCKDRYPRRQVLPRTDAALLANVDGR